ncbi:MAG: ABC transporter permease [Alicyclobacillus sp.]|nr:ABC transporter permease [Alicyclobacillus sp.]
MAHLRAGTGAEPPVRFTWSAWSMRLSSRVTFAFLMAIALLLIGGITTPGFLQPSHVLTILSISAFLGIIALAQTIVIISGGEGIDLSIGSFVSLGAVMSSKIINGANEHLWQAILAVMVTGLVLGAVNGVGIAYFGIPPLVMTLAMSSVIQGLAIVYTNGQPTGQAAPALAALGTGTTAGVPNILIAWILIGVVAVLAFTRTRWGSVMFGVGANPLVAQLAGARSNLNRASAYALGGMIAMLGGLCLLGYTGTSYLDLGSSYVMTSIMAVVIGGVSLAGGTGSYLGTMAGAVVLTTLSSILVTLQLGDGGKQVVYGAMLLGILAVYSLRNKS